MARIAAADGQAMQLLVERWSARLLAFFTRALGSRDDADDLAQETFVRVIRAAPAYRAEGRFAAWLFRIAGNLVRGEIRRRKVRTFFTGASAQADAETLLASLPAPAAFDADGPLHDAELRAVLAREIAALPARQRLAVLLRHFEGLALRDVAEALGVGEEAASSLVARGTRRLRERLQRAGWHPR